ncbi:MAG TPA: type II toxin-antitoxin system CcdA family antitoxin [Caulobacteraceae bacterium]|jgi:antitoxin CcdA|nr:type II toxin-antitoxin system CcdA family antitoxin [Caulobacteraceae bacterium]
MGKTELRIEIDTLLLDQARTAELQVAIVVERALKAALGPAAAEERAKRWAAENAPAIEAHNRHVEEFGTFGEEWRSW